MSAAQSRARPATELTRFHRHFPGSVRWRLTPRGLEVEGSGIERTTGQPTTVTRVWERHAEVINAAARRFDVPVELIVATICTESTGKADAVRTEPGWVSDRQTPHRVSVGLMQTLISTARTALGDQSLDRRRLCDPATAVAAGTAFISQQGGRTKLDPPLVAAAYNAGGLYEQTGAANRWKLRQFPIGTGKHVDRFVRWFNDFVAVLADHPVRPTVSFRRVPAWPHLTAPHAGTIAAPHRDCDTVRAWQRQMASRGASITVDGHFGPKSRDVLLAFQKKAFTDPKEHDGRLGRRSWEQAFV